MEVFSMDREPSEIQQSIRRGQVKLRFSDMSRVGMPVKEELLVICGIQ